jgi:hypothetical protein
MPSTSDELALLTLFGSEPALLDPGVPWIYNRATYRIERDGYRISLEIKPSYRELKVSVESNGRSVSQALLSPFADLRVEMDEQAELLIVRFDQLSRSVLFLTLRPDVSLSMVAG